MELTKEQFFDIIEAFLLEEGYNKVNECALRMDAKTYKRSTAKYSEMIISNTERHTIAVGFGDDERPRYQWTSRYMISPWPEPPSLADPEFFQWFKRCYDL
jgi:hypothetical protein